jgi:hypothetical protein
MAFSVNNKYKCVNYKWFLLISLIKSDMAHIKLLMAIKISTNFHKLDKI